MITTKSTSPRGIRRYCSAASIHARVRHAMLLAQRAGLPTCPRSMRPPSRPMYCYVFSSVRPERSYVSRFAGEDDAGSAGWGLPCTSLRTVWRLRYSACTQMLTLSGVFEVAVYDVDDWRPKAFRDHVFKKGVGASFRRSSMTCRSSYSTRTLAVRAWKRPFTTRKTGDAEFTGYSVHLVMFKRSFRSTSRRKPLPSEYRHTCSFRQQIL